MKLRRGALLMRKEKWDKEKVNVDKSRWQEYQKGIAFEYKIVKDTQMADYFLFRIYSLFHASTILFIAVSMAERFDSKLEAKGYITRQRGSDDERQLIVAITAAGDALRERAVEVPVKMAGCVCLSADESRQLYTLLNKVLDSFE